VSEQPEGTTYVVDQTSGVEKRCSLGPSRMRTAMSECSVVVIGAGPAGISAALSLKDLGIRPLLVERAGEVAASWRGRYHRLKLNTGRQFSHLPGRRYPKGTPVYPTRDQVVEHFDRHAREDGIELRLATSVERIDRCPSGSPPAISTHRSFRIGRVASPLSCCTLAPIAAPHPLSASACSSSDRDRQAWKSLMI